MPDGEVSVISVLGHALDQTGQPSALLKERCRVGARLAQEVQDAVVIPTGGDPQQVGVTEAAAMLDILQEHGVPRDRVELEEQAWDTASNAFFVLYMARKKVGRGVVRLHLVTSAYHMPRSAWTFMVVGKAMGVQIVLEEHPAPWVGNKLEEGGSIRQEMRLLENSPWLLERSLKKYLGTKIGVAEDFTQARAELQELLELAEGNKL